MLVILVGSPSPGSQVACVLFTGFPGEKRTALSVILELNSRITDFHGVLCVCVYAHMSAGTYTPHLIHGGQRTTWELVFSFPVALGFELRLSGLRSYFTP